MKFSRTTVLAFAILYISLLGSSYVGGARRPAGSDKEQSKDYDTSSANLIKQQDNVSNSILGSSFEETLIRVGEPYKSVLQTTVRFSLAQTQLTNHVNIDTAMHVINSASFMLFKPKILLKVVKATAVIIFSFIAASFLFPGAYQTLEATWRNPTAVGVILDRYLSNGISTKSVIEVLNSRTDEYLNEFGLQESSCREQSICYLGSMIKCSFPHTSKALTKFAQANLANTTLSENNYVKVFLTGFEDQNCSSIVLDDSESPDCLGNFVRTILEGRNRRRRSNIRH